jgi:hypothetical protein
MSWTLRLTALVLAGLGAAPAAAQQRCVRVLGWRSGDCPAEVERGTDRAEGDFWRDRSRSAPGARSIGPVVPGAGPGGLMFMPVPGGGPTREGSMSLDDLALHPDGRGGYLGRRPGYRFDIERDGTLHFQDPPPVQGLAVVGLGLAAVFDLTDLVMRARGMDPYSFDKGRVAEITRKMREKMSAVERPRRLAAALARLPDELEGLWRRTDMTEGERRQTLFQLWDDLLEGGSGSARAGDEAEVRAAEQARTELLRFIQRRLPLGTRAAFTGDELTRWNAQRHSRLPFTPYQPAPPAETPGQ